MSVRNADLEQGVRVTSCSPERAVAMGRQMSQKI